MQRMRTPIGKQFRDHSEPEQPTQEEEEVEILEVSERQEMIQGMGQPGVNTLRRTVWKWLGTIVAILSLLTLGAITG